MKGAFFFGQLQKLYLTRQLGDEPPVHRFAQEVRAGLEEWLIQEVQMEATS